MKKVIYVYGASGSGTSTLGKAIAENYGYRRLDTDDYFWLPTDPPFVMSRERPERLRLLREDLDAADKAVISGSLYDWGDDILPEVTLGVGLLPPLKCGLSGFGQGNTPGSGSGYGKAATCIKTIWNLSNGPRAMTSTGRKSAASGATTGRNRAFAVPSYGWTAQGRLRKRWR